MRAARQAGFTLIELLVAIFITAILFAMGYSALSQAITSREEVDEQSARLTAMQQALRIMEQDLELMQPRPDRDVLGNGYQNPLIVNQKTLEVGLTGTIGGSAGSAAQMSLAQISFTRGGWANPAGLPRSELQRVGYLLQEGKLVRLQLPVLDTTAAVSIEERELIDQVDSLRFRFYLAGAWYDDWPPPPALNGPPHDLLRMRPNAVEITLKLKDAGTLLRIVEVAG
jgi:general secretion pathway protein J